MGVDTERYRAKVQEARAQGRISTRQTGRETKERRLEFMESELGTAEQAAGFGYDPAVTPFTRRYTFDEGITEALGGKHYGPDGISGRGLTRDPKELENRFGTSDPAELEKLGVNVFRKPTRQFGPAAGITGYTRNVVGAANDLMAQAQKAAAAGDMDEAERLAAEADKLISKSNPTLGGPEGEAWKRSISMTENPEFSAKAQLSSPMALTVGNLVFQGREFLDPESGTSQRFRESLTAGAMESIEAGRTSQLRQLTAGARGVERGVRQTGLARGAARSATGEAAILARSGERFGTSAANVEMNAAATRAQIIGEADRFFEDYSRSFAANTAVMAQAFLQNQSGIREQFQGSLDTLASVAANFSNSAADRAFQFAQLSAMEAMQSRQLSMDLVSSVAGLAVGAAGAGAGAALGGLGGLAGAGGGGGGGGTPNMPADTPFG